MNASSRIVARRLASALGPRLTAPSRYTHTAISTGSKDRTVMRAVFTGTTVVVISGVAYAASRSGTRMNSRYNKKNSSLDSSKWFDEGADVKHWLGTKN